MTIAVQGPGPDKPEPWVERWARNPLVIAVGLLFGASVGLVAVYQVLTEVLPWLLTFTGPVADLLKPVIEFAVRNADWITYYLVTLVLAALAYRLGVRNQQWKQESIERDRATAEMIARSEATIARADAAIARFRANPPPSRWVGKAEPTEPSAEREVVVSQEDVSSVSKDKVVDDSDIE